jgi:hypothetical protein
MLSDIRIFDEENEEYTGVLSELIDAMNELDAASSSYEIEKMGDHYSVATTFPSEYSVPCLVSGRRYAMALAEAVRIIKVRNTRPSRVVKG